MFKNADRIWLKGLTKEINIQARFNAEFVIPENARLYITGATFYKVYQPLFENAVNYFRKK